MQPASQPTPVNKPRRAGERRPELICRVKYTNTLPDLPFDPKSITYPFDSERFVAYKPTSLEKNHKHDILTEPDLGVKVDLVDIDRYNPPEGLNPTDYDFPQLDNDDEKLIEEEQNTTHTSKHDLKRSQQHNKIIPWLKKTEYISTEFNRYGASSEKNETKVGYNVKKMLKDENPYMDKESQISAIDKTFKDAKKPITEHPTKKNVHPVQVIPVFPDFESWKYPFAQVIFDAEPANVSHEEMGQAMIRGVMDESGEQFVAYFLPTAETMMKRERDAENGVDYIEGEEYEYNMAREYNWNVQNKSHKSYEENYFFVFKEDGVYYNELETRVRLTKRRKHGDSQPNRSKLVVKHRQLNEQEYKSQELRMRFLQPPQEDEEEEENGEVKKEEEQQGENNVNQEEPQNVASEKEQDSDSDSSESKSSSESEAEEPEEEKQKEKKPVIKKEGGKKSIKSKAEVSSSSSSSEQESDNESNKKVIQQSSSSASSSDDDSD